MRTTFASDLVQEYKLTGLDTFWVNPEHDMAPLLRILLFCIENNVFRRESLQNVTKYLFYVISERGDIPGAGNVMKHVGFEIHRLTTREVIFNVDCAQDVYTNTVVDILCEDVQQHLIDVLIIAAEVACSYYTKKSGSEFSAIFPVVEAITSVLPVIINFETKTGSLAAVLGCGLLEECLSLNMWHPQLCRSVIRILEQSSLRMFSFSVKSCNFNGEALFAADFNSSAAAGDPDAIQESPDSQALIICDISHPYLNPRYSCLGSYLCEETVWGNTWIKLPCGDVPFQPTTSFCVLLAIRQSVDILLAAEMFDNLLSKSVSSMTLNGVLSALQLPNYIFYIMKIATDITQCSEQPSGCPPLTPLFRNVCATEEYMCETYQNLIDKKDKQTARVVFASGMNVWNWSEAEADAYEEGLKESWQTITDNSVLLLSIVAATDPNNNLNNNVTGRAVLEGCNQLPDPFQILQNKFIEATAEGNLIVAIATLVVLSQLDPVLSPVGFNLSPDISINILRDLCSSRTCSYYFNAICILLADIGPDKTGLPQLLSLSKVLKKLNFNVGKWMPSPFRPSEKVISPGKRIAAALEIVVASLYSPMVSFSMPSQVVRTMKELLPENPINVTFPSEDASQYYTNQSHRYSSERSQVQYNSNDECYDSNQIHSVSAIDDYDNYQHDEGIETNQENDVIEYDLSSSPQSDIIS